MRFQVGDPVVYPSQGAGRVEEKTEREVLGETQEYLKIAFIRGDMEGLVPLRKAQEVGLRPTVAVDEIDALREAIRAGDLNLPTQWPPRYRAEQDILAAGSAMELASLIGVLAKRDLEKGLAATEREVLENAKEMLGSELAVVQGMSLKEAADQLEEFINEAVSSGA